MDATPQKQPCRDLISPWLPPPTAGPSSTPAPVQSPASAHIVLAATMMKRPWLEKIISTFCRSDAAVWMGEGAVQIYGSPSRAKIVNLGPKATNIDVKIVAKWPHMANTWSRKGDQKFEQA